ncbi:hypothetical protein NEAUS04_0558 [Nematocida ausubeli]|uniref:Uncharacterized protein n=1 Tax=Nematocida ausubeli (strain ATCC PRA-371 / ERTm2) TaxID=1913371 RepID=A0A086J024_NEMA1|nr:uncharacterized protein NESG_02267 [Nematocida ausubeli]KAI5147295.1 hypothetical protein NEAUS05_0608 [Nematocida ausubeli]KAI5161484.1 hypothetical protein NEAUS04_0558 [Nematocida ausubeli]KFG25492.1 hypothetical protein NESG_02267 [Nematocida ausubeli]
MDIEDVSNIKNIQLGDEQDVFINPEGPLNLMHGYVNARNGYMYNKRFYSSEIETDYSMRKNKEAFSSPEGWVFERTPVKDKVYKDLCKKTPAGKYLIRYHAQLIKMFPSVDGSLSIEAGRPNALTNFLRAEHVKKDAKYILAALLLLSEGVDIEIDVDKMGEKKSLVIKSKKCKGRVFVNVDMHSAWIDPVTQKKSDRIYQSETEKIVGFYKHYRDSRLLKKGGEFAMPTSKREFNKGNFLNNAGFLIQTYIYEFIDNFKNYRSFVEAVYELFIDQMTDHACQDSFKEKKDVFDRLFLVKDALHAQMEYISSFCDLARTTHEDASFPFYNPSQLPQYTRVPQYKLDKSGFEKDQFLYYSNCVESALLGIFCCLAYNPETGRYETDHMGTEVSDELRDFFKKYPKPTETTDFEMHKEWCKVVACLKNESISYKHPKNEILSGLSNVFRVIAEITGQKTDALELVKYIEDACKIRSLKKDDKDYIESKIESIFISLSQNKSIMVKCRYMVLGRRSDGEQDIFADIDAMYMYDNRENGITLGLKPKHATLDVLLSSPVSVRIEEKYEDVKELYRSIDSYMGYITSQYISREMKNLRKDSFEMTESLMKSIDVILNSGYNNVFKIFLLEKLVGVKCMSFIAMRCVIYSIDKDLPPNDPIVRFTANVIGSIPLNDPATWREIMKYFLYHSERQANYPKLEYEARQELEEIKITGSELVKIHLYILNQDSDSLAVKCINNYVKLGTDNANMYYLLSVEPMSRKLFNLMARAGTPRRFEQLRSTLEKTKNQKYTDDLDFVYIVWFIYACDDSESTPEIIKMAYNFINFSYLSQDVSSKLKSYRIYSSTVMSVLKKEKTNLCTENDSDSMKNYQELEKYFKLHLI